MRFNRTIIICSALLALAVGCAGPVVKTDLETYKKDPAEYQGKRVIFTTDISAVMQNPQEYAGERVELSGYVEYVGFWASSYWNFFLKDEDGVTIKCYERNYHHYAWIMPVRAVRRAEKNNEPITVVGLVESGPKLELSWIEYEGQRYDTNYRPATLPLTYR